MAPYSQRPGRCELNDGHTMPVPEVARGRAMLAPESANKVPDPWNTTRSPVGTSSTNGLRLIHLVCGKPGACVVCQVVGEGFERRPGRRAAPGEVGDLAPRSRGERALCGSSINSRMTERLPFLR